MNSIIPVLIAGGSGTRLWPTSRKSYPKQFVDLANSGKSLMQLTLERSKIVANLDPWIVITNEAYRFLVAQQANDINANIGAILLEPVSRNTAPAIALAAFEALSQRSSASLLIQTADHFIKNLTDFAETVKRASDLKAPLILFGVKPSRPDTGYGYIECGDQITDEFVVSSFHEKPDLEKAKRYLSTGNFLWNSGMFMLDAESYLAILMEYEPQIYSACEEAYKQATVDLDFKRIDRAIFSKSPCISIDYAILEHARNLRVLPYSGDWFDLGAWDSVAEISDKDADGNVIQGDAAIIDCRNTFIRSEERLVTGIGLEDLVIVETRDAILVADSTRTQDVKRLVDTLKVDDRSEIITHKRMHRPWGSYETLVSGNRFQVKRIIVNPGCSLSLQMHHHRAEHWIVVSGTADVQVENNTQMLTEDQSIYIPIGAKHRLTNPGKLELTLIEVQSGAYLGEDDILRFEDVYGRVADDDAI